VFRGGQLTGITLKGYGDRNISDRYVEFWNWQKYIQQPILVALVSGNFLRSLGRTYWRSLHSGAFGVNFNFFDFGGKLCDRHKFYALY
jgi:hypothetical protein